MWKHISQVGHLFYPHTDFFIENGRRVRFWKDLWWGNSTLDLTYHRLYCIASNKNTLVAKILSHDVNGLSWHLLFTRKLYEWEVPSVGNLMNDLNMIYISSSDRDSRIWSPSLDGLFSFKSFLFVLLRKLCSLFPFHKIWSTAVPPWVKAFNWVVSLNTQNTMDILKRRCPFMALSPLVCCLYGVSGETDIHLFIHCHHATRV